MGPRARSNGWRQIFRRETKRFLFCLRVRAQVVERNFDARWGWMDDLHYLIAVPLERGSPCFMPANDFGKTAFQGRNIQLAVPMDRDRLVIN